MFGCIYHISYNRAGCRQFSCAASVEHRIPQHIAVDHDRIKYIVHAEQRAVTIDHNRAYHRIVLVPDPLTAGQKLDGCAKCLCITDIRGSDLRDSLGIDLLKIHMMTVCQRRKNRDLSAGIPTLDISCRVALRIAEFLCILQHILKLGTIACHLA